MFCSKFRDFLLIVFRVFEALSSIVFSSNIQDSILSEIDLLEYSASKYPESIGYEELSKKSLLKYFFKSYAFFKMYAKFNKDFVDNEVPLSKIFISVVISEKL